MALAARGSAQREVRVICPFKRTCGVLIDNQQTTPLIGEKVLMLDAEDLRHIRMIRFI
jgi:hypothetical protein